MLYYNQTKRQISVVYLRLSVLSHHRIHLASNGLATQPVQMKK